MNGLGASVSVGLLLGWLVFAVVGSVLPAWAALLPGLAAGGICATRLRTHVAIQGLVALLAPFGVMLPALALRDIVVAFGVPVPGFSGFELFIFLLLYTGFLTSAFGKGPIDLYRFGYAPKPVAAMTLVMCLYSLLTGNWFLALVAVLAQGAWSLRLGSGNWFDHISHLLLWPIALLALLI